MDVREHPNLTIQRVTKGRIPDLPFLAVKKAILGSAYDLSLIFPDQETSIRLHVQWKNENDPVNVFAFPLDEETGEIFITLSKARIEAPNYDHSYLEHVLFLFIHACLHLKGYDHGDTMEEQEQKYLKKFLPKARA
jgi:probable rRNA maturation factor